MNSVNYKIVRRDASAVVKLIYSSIFKALVQWIDTRSMKRLDRHILTELMMGGSHSV